MSRPPRETHDHHDRYDRQLGSETYLMPELDLIAALCDGREEFSGDQHADARRAGAVLRDGDIGRGVVDDELVGSLLRVAVLPIALGDPCSGIRRRSSEHHGRYHKGHHHPSARHCDSRHTVVMNDGVDRWRRESKRESEQQGGGPRYLRHGAVRCAVVRVARAEGERRNRADVAAAASRQNHASDRINPTNHLVYFNSLFGEVDAFHASERENTNGEEDREQVEMGERTLSKKRKMAMAMEMGEMPTSSAP